MQAKFCDQCLQQEGVDDVAIPKTARRYEAVIGGVRYDLQVRLLRERVTRTGRLVMATADMCEKCFRANAAKILKATGWPVEVPAGEEPDHESQ